MSLFKKKFRSILGLSNSEDQLTPPDWNIPIPGAGGLLLLITPVNIESPTIALESVATKPPASVPSAAENQESGKMPILSGEISSSDEIQHSIAGDIVLRGSGVGIGGGVDRFATLTEALGFESLNVSTEGGGLTSESSPESKSFVGVRSRRETMPRERRSDESKTVKSFPPLLSTLKENGRPRFDLIMVERDGRFKIVMVPNNRPEVVRIHSGDGRTRLVLLNTDHHRGGNKAGHVGKCGPSSSESEKGSEEEEEEEEREDGGGEANTEANGVFWPFQKERDMIL